MKKKCYSIIVLILVAVGACAHVPSSIQNIVSSAAMGSKQQVSAIGYLCVDFASAFLSDVDNCNFDNGFKVPLVLDRKEMNRARNLRNGAQVLVKGELHTPPIGAVKMTHGILLGYSIKVVSMVPATE